MTLCWFVWTALERQHDISSYFALAGSRLWPRGPRAQGQAGANTSRMKRRTESQGEGQEVGTLGIVGVTAFSASSIFQHWWLRGPGG